MSVNAVAQWLGNGPQNPENQQDPEKKSKNVVGGEGQESELPPHIREILESSCVRCHGPGKPEFSVTGDLLSRKNLLESITYQEDSGRSDNLVVAGKPEKSVLWDEIELDSMPRDGTPLTAAQKKAIRAWIEAGAPGAAPALPRQGISAVKQGSANTSIPLVSDSIIAADFRSLSKEKQKTVRYLDLRHLRHEPERLEVVHAAIRKVTNSLHWRPRIVPVHVVEGSHGTVVRLDIAEYDWSLPLWQEIVRDYPFETGDLVNPDVRGIGNGDCA